MCDDPVIPERNRARRPLPANCEVDGIEEVLAEEGKYVARFLSVELIDPFNECWVIVQGFDTGHWVGANLY